MSFPCVQWSNSSFLIAAAVVIFFKFAFDILYYWLWILYHSFHLCAIPVFSSLVLVCISYKLLFWVEGNDELMTYAITSKSVVRPHFLCDEIVSWLNYVFSGAGKGVSALGSLFLAPVITEVIEILLFFSPEIVPAFFTEPFFCWKLWIHFMFI